MGVDMCVPIGVLFSLIGTHLNTVLSKKTTPRTVRAVPRRLTKPLSEVTVMADNQSTQTRPEFTWRFLFTSERYPTAKPLVIYVNASSEQEARDTMPGVTLVFAARLPFHAFQSMEVRHA
ncbi:host cell division inhibitor Icd-like protein [Klebsiella grimontii]|uniref:host cell division inhibitor Icd-like protein n=2 Tax=Klebsiella TaxID=570 RepID=UPI0027D2B382